MRAQRLPILLLCFGALGEQPCCLCTLGPPVISASSPLGQLQQGRSAGPAPCVSHKLAPVAAVRAALWAILAAGGRRSVPRAI